MLKKPLVSIVIVNWNGEDYLDACLDSITHQTFIDYETIVVDNGSSDGSLEVLERYGRRISLIRNPKNLGYCRGNNIGCDAAQGEWLFLLNADTRLAPNAMEELAAIARQELPSWIGIIPKVLFDRAPFFINSLGVHWHHLGHWRDIRVGRMDLGRFQDGEQVFGAIFPAVLFHAQRFREIGGFDERFFSYCEDFDACYRANIMGYKFYTAPKAEILHAYRSSIRTDAARRWHTYLFTRNYLLVFLKNYQARSLLQYGRQILRRYLIAPIRRAAQAGDRRELYPYFKALAWLILNSPMILKKRLPLQLHRRVKDQELWNFSAVEETNLFHQDNFPVMSLLALRTAIDERREYLVESQPYVTY